MIDRMKRPYVINSMELITYSGKHILLEILELNVLDKPVKLLKERILDSFSTMVDRPVDVKLGIRYI